MNSVVNMLSFFYPKPHSDPTNFKFIEKDERHSGLVELEDSEVREETFSSKIL